MLLMVMLALTHKISDRLSLVAWNDASAAQGAGPLSMRIDLRRGTHSSRMKVLGITPEGLTQGWTYIW